MSGFGRLGERRVPLNGALNAKVAVPIIPIFGIEVEGTYCQLRVLFVALVEFLLCFESQALGCFGRLGERRVLFFGTLIAKKTVPISPISAIHSVGMAWQLRVLFVALKVFCGRFESQALSGFGRLGERCVLPIGASSAKEVVPTTPIFGIKVVGRTWQLRIFLVVLIVFRLCF